MQNLSFKEQCINLRKAGYTLPEIMEKTGRSKTTVYFHIKDIPLSTKRIQQWHKASGRRIAQFNHARKGKSCHDRHPIPFTTWTPELVMLVGHFMFDGEITYSSCVYNNRSNALINRVQKLTKLVYQYEPAKIIKPDGVQRISYFNVEFAAYMKGKKKELLKDIMNLEQEAQRHFLQSFFDDEGCITFDIHDNRRKIRGYQHDKKLLQLVQTLLRNFDIESGINASNTELFISRRKNLEQFQKEINFSPGVKINGKRSNSLWKKSLEKRKILQMAIDSYQQ